MAYLKIEKKNEKELPCEYIKDAYLEKSITNYLYLHTQTIKQTKFLFYKFDSNRFGVW